MPVLQTSPRRSKLLVMKHVGLILSLLAGASLFAFGAVELPAAEDNSCGMPSALYERVDGVLSAPQKLNYTGTLLVEYGGDREFIAVRSDSAVTSFRRLSRQAGDAPRPISPLPVMQRGPCGLVQSYGLMVEAGAGAVAGRSTYRMTARPKDTLRLAYVMDIDAELHMPLRVLTASPEGQILEHYEFADVSFEERLETEELVAPADVAGYRLAAIPPGFTLVSEGSKPADFLVLSDGLASVSVFIENQPRSLPSGEGIALRGATLTYTRGTANDRLITVLGEIPVPTARLLADAVRLREDG